MPRQKKAERIHNAEQLLLNVHDQICYYCDKPVWQMDRNGCCCLRGFDSYVMPHLKKRVKSLEEKELINAATRFKRKRKPV